jgi:hypothetical protein
VNRRSLYSRGSYAARVAAPGGGAVEAFDNWASINGVGGNAPHTQTQGAANDVCVAAVGVTCKYSGVFAVSAAAGYSSGTTAKTIEHKVILLDVALPIASPTFSHGTPTGGSFGNDVGTDPDAAHRSKFTQILNADAAGVSANGVEYNGAPVVGGFVLLDTGPTPTLTGLLSGSAQSLSLSTTTGSATGPKTRFAVGHFVIAAILLTSTAGGDVVTYQYASVTLTEQPLP